MPRLARLVLIALLAVACESGDPETAATTTPSLALTTSLPPVTTTTFAVPTSTAPGSTTTTPAVDRYEIVDGEFQGPESFTVMVGETFEIEVVSDAAGELHVHGFDLFFEMAADRPTLVEFAAFAPGIFEVELEGSHAHLFDVEVVG